MKIATILLGAIIGLWLLDDAMTFALLADPLTGRAEGCYTTIELFLGVKQPSAIRGAQFLIGVALGFGLPLASGAQAMIRRRHKRSPAAGG